MQPRCVDRQTLWVTFVLVLPVADLPSQVPQPVLIDFEGYEEGAEVSDNYADIGVTFALVLEEGDDLGLKPIIAVKGPPLVAFDGWGIDGPMASCEAGLTDPLINDDPVNDRDIRAEFSSPVSEVSLYLCDIETIEHATIRAFVGDQEVDSCLVPGRGSGSVQFCKVSAASITSVVIDVEALDGQVGYAIDDFSFTPIEYVPARAPTPFMRGDSNGDGIHDISDAVSILNFLFRSREPLPCIDAADTDDDGVVVITDAIVILGFLFLGEGTPAAPFPECGTDETEDCLRCLSYPPCG